MPWALFVVRSGSSLDAPNRLPHETSTHMGLLRVGLGCGFDRIWGWARPMLDALDQTRGGFDQIGDGLDQLRSNAQV